MMSRTRVHPDTPNDISAQAHERIVLAALTLIESEGLEAFSTRKLASSLGLKVMSLYHYFPSREALLDKAVDKMISEVPLPNIEQTEWRYGLLELARNYRAMGHRHLQAVPLLAQRCPSSPTMQMFLETISGLLLKSGLPPNKAEDWLLIQRDYVIGSLIADHAAQLFSTGQVKLNCPDGGDTHDYRPINLANKNREHVFEKGFISLLDAIEREG